MTGARVLTSVECLAFIKWKKEARGRKREQKEAKRRRGNKKKIRKGRQNWNFKGEGKREESSGKVLQSWRMFKVIYIFISKRGINPRELFEILSAKRSRAANTENVDWNRCCVCLHFLIKRCRIGIWSRVDSVPVYTGYTRYHSKERLCPFCSWI